jgi:hypothetical protein
MCFISTPPQPSQSEANSSANADANAEMTRRRKAQGYGASLLTSPGSLGPAPLGRQTLGGQ